MSLKKRIIASKYKLFISVIPIAVIYACLKTIFYFFDFDFIPKEMISFFPSIFTSIIFILAFLLSGVVSDFKESEKIPNDILMT